MWGEAKIHRTQFHRGPAPASCVCWQRDRVGKREIHSTIRSCSGELQTHLLFFFHLETLSDDDGMLFLTMRCWRLWGSIRHSHAGWIFCIISEPTRMSYLHPGAWWCLMLATLQKRRSANAPFLRCGSCLPFTWDLCKFLGAICYRRIIVILF